MKRPLEVLNSDRKRWVGHLTPAKAKVGSFYREGFLTSIPRPESKKYLKFIFSKFSQFQQNYIFVNPKHIFLSSRVVSKVIDNSLVIESLFDQQGVESPPPLSNTLTTQKLLDFFSSTTTPSGGIPWTITEISIGTNTTPQAVIKALERNKEQFLLLGTEYCSLSLKQENLYTMASTPIDCTSLDREPMETLYYNYCHCTLCPLGTSRESRGKAVAFGRGKHDAKALILGEAPGKWEEDTREVFYYNAPAGELLQRVMKAVGLNQKDFYLTNAVICRPVGTGTSENRPPSTDEIIACRQRLKRVLRTVSPKLVILLGITAYEAFFGEKPPDNKLNGNLGWVSKKDNEGRIINYEVFLTYHPSYVKRHESIEISVEDRNKVKKTYLEHWTQIAEKFKLL